MDRNALMAALQERQIPFGVGMTDKQLQDLVGVTELPAESVTLVPTFVEETPIIEVDTTNTEEPIVAEFLPPKNKGGRPKKTK